MRCDRSTCTYESRPDNPLRPFRNTLFLTKLGAAGDDRIIHMRFVNSVHDAECLSTVLIRQSERHLRSGEEDRQMHRTIVICAQHLRWAAVCLSLTVLDHTVWAQAEPALKVSVDWNVTIETSKTASTLMIEAHPLLREGKSLHDVAF